MSDNQPPAQTLGSSEVPIEGPPVKRPCTIDTPPISLTPADDGSDFYNTPLAAGTPADIGAAKDQVDAAQNQANESDVPSNAHPLIPGLNLVNDSIKDLQSEEIESQSTTTLAGEHEGTASASQPATALGEAEKMEGIKGEPAVGGIDAMEVDANEKQETQQSEGNATGIESTSAPGEASAMNGAEDAQDEQDDEHPEWEIDSSPYESSSDDSSTDSSDDSDDDDEDYPILSPEEQARILMQAELGSDDEGDGKGKSGGHLRTANEIDEEAPPIPEITITPEMKVVLLGHVEAIVENTLLISANTTGEYQVLEAGSLLCLENRNVAGVVSETLGRVENPLYAVRYPTAATITERGLSKGTNVFYVVEYSTFVFTQPLKGLKGSDASNFHDEEIAEDEVEFSDDEAEAEYKRKLKQKRQEKKDARNENGPARGRRGPPGPSKLNQSELNYDDNAADDGYTPLARPKNLHEMMRQQEAPVEADGHSGPSRNNSGFRGGRGRGRGGDRGRGGRGGRGGGPGSRDSHESTSHQDRQTYYQHQHQHQQHQAQSSQPQQHHPYPQQAYPAAPQGAYALPQQFTSFAPFQPQQSQPYGQGAVPTPFNFQMPFQQAYQQPNPYQQLPANVHINPLFLAALQQQQQQQQQPQQAPGQQPQQPTMNFDQVKAQLDLLRQLSNNNQGPPRT
ncbi:NAF1-domain-containing protein [Aspergillus sclerotioniger CBS 115572]|uniref:H/ACA ribonucleoprotein complex non-core subunit NAF1 n=1 Tax=Aspergillus sclerotioniger CBS 115572 TaxID=1450535 RepID=A0A317XAS1_9EURO|nr:NAF1-domain-containing protein [Aspergillus sclerotioniger CBS 115572]PWY94732.1 NAF1-domain-containing protein [Aspergillus sclerotioniger CBS 115572]